MPSESPVPSASVSPPSVPPPSVRESPRRRPLGVWTALLTAGFAVGVFATTDGVLRLLADPAPTSTPAASSSPATSSSPAAPPSSSGPPASASGAVPAGAGAPASGTAPAAPPATPATKDAASASAANDSAADDTNVEEAAEGPRRAAPVKPAEDDAPEFRESADNNISLPVDI